MNEYNQIVSKFQQGSTQYEQQMNEMGSVIQELSLENNQLKEKKKNENK